MLASVPPVFQKKGRPARTALRVKSRFLRSSLWDIRPFYSAKMFLEFLSFLFLVCLVFRQRSSFAVVIIR